MAHIDGLCENKVINFFSKMSYCYLPEELQFVVLYLSAKQHVHELYASFLAPEMAQIEENVKQSSISGLE